MASYKGVGFEIEWVWKEIVIYWEGDSGFSFDAGWGVTPGVLYVPSERMWDDVMPENFRGRRDEIVARLRDHSAHTLAEDDADVGSYRDRPESRWVNRRP